MNRNVRQVIFWIVLPVVIGGTLYYCIAPDAFFVKILDEFFRNSFRPKILISNSFMAFVRNYVLDILWAIAFTAAIFIYLKPVYKKEIGGIMIGIIVFEIIMEVIQLLPNIAGTFDACDIVAEMLATIYVILVIMGGFCNEKYSKLFGIGALVLAFAIMSLGSGSSTDNKKEISASDSSNVSSEINTGTNENSVSESSEGITVDEQILIDKDGLKVTATGYETDSIWGDEVKLLIENETDKNIGLGCSALIVNDYMITDLFSSTIAAGKKANENMYLSSSALKAAGIDNVGKIEIYFYAFDPDTYMTVDNFDCVTIKTSAYSEMDITPNDAGQELFNSNGVRIVGKYVDEASFWGAGVLLYIENNSGENVIVQCDDMSINGFMVTPYFSASVYDGKKSLSDITILSSDLEANNITSVDDIELVFKIINENNFSIIEQSEPIKFSAK